MSAYTPPTPTTTDDGPRCSRCGSACEWVTVHRPALRRGQEDRDVRLFRCTACRIQHTPPHPDPLTIGQTGVEAATGPADPRADTVAITARGPRQRDALSWLLGKPLPEGFEDIGLTPDDEWGFLLGPGRVERHDDGNPTTIHLPAAWVEAWWGEVADGHRQHVDFRQDTGPGHPDYPEVVAVLYALRTMTTRHGRDFETGEAI